MSRVQSLVLKALLCWTFQGIFVPSISAWAQAPAETAPGQSAQEATAAASPTTSAPIGPEDVVMTVGDRKITAAEFEKLAASLPQQYSGAVQSLGKKAFADQYGNLVGLALEGKKLQIDQRDTFRQMMEFQQTLLLAQTTLNELATTTGLVSPEEVDYYYTSHQMEFSEIKLRGIYIPFDQPPIAGAAGEGKPPQQPPPTPKAIRSEAEARTKAETLRRRIEGGEDMAALAKKESEHNTSANGGDFGYVRRNQFAPQIDNIIFALQDKQVSTPVKDRFGYFIFQSEGKRTQPLTEARSTIENSLRQQKLMDVLGKLKTTYPVTLDPRYFPDTPPTLGQPTSPMR